MEKSKHLLTLYYIIIIAVVFYKGDSKNVTISSFSDEIDDSMRLNKQTRKNPFRIYIIIY